MEADCELDAIAWRLKVLVEKRGGYNMSGRSKNTPDPLGRRRGKHYTTRPV